MYSLNENVMLQNLNNPSYNNPLKVQKQLRPQEMSYQYNPNLGGQQASNYSQAPSGQPLLMNQGSRV